MSFVSRPELALPRHNRHRQLTFQLWPTARPCFATFTRLTFNLCVKPGIAQRLVLVQRQTDIVDGRFVEVRAKQASIGCLPETKGAVVDIFCAQGYIDN